MKNFNKKLILLLFLLSSLLLNENAQAVTKTTVSSGMWNMPGNWTPGGVPSTGDDVVIAHNITLNGSATVLSLTINTGGTLLTGSNNLTVSANTTINGTLEDNVAGGTTTFGALNINAGGILRDIITSGSNTFTFNGAVNNAGTVSASAQSANTTTFNFNHDILNSGTFTLGNNGAYYFNKAGGLTITPNAPMSFGYSSGGGGSAYALSDVTIANGNSGGDDVNFNIFNNLDISNNKTFTNSNTFGRLRFSFAGGLNGSAGATNAKFTNGAYLEYRSNFLIMTVGLTDFYTNPNTVEYARQGSHDIKGTNYANLIISGGGTTHTKTLSYNTVANDLTIQSNQTLNLNSFALTMKGNLINNKGGANGNECFGNTPTGDVIFDSNNSNQTITNAVKFYKLTVNNTNTAPDNTVVLTANIDVMNKITFTNGRVKTGNFDVTLQAAAYSDQIQVTNVNSYIETNGTGRLVRQNLTVGNSQVYEFPVGDAVSLRKIGYELQSGSGNYTASAAFAPENPITSPIPPVGAYDFGAGKWRLQCAWSNTAPLFYAPGTANNLANIHRNNAGWVKIGGSFNSGNYGTNALDINAESIFAIFAVLQSPKTTSATASNQSGFTANWATVPDADGYKLDVSTQNNFSSFVAGYNNADVPIGTTNTKIVNGLSANTVYYYRVRSYKTAPAITSPNSNVKMTSTILPAGSGNSLRFNGINQYVKSPIPTTNSGGITMEAWVRLDGINLIRNQSIIQVGNSGSNGWGIIVKSGLSPDLLVRYNGTLTPIGYTMPINKWTHIALVNAVNDQYELYVNGVVYSGTTGNVPAAPTSGLQIGNDSIANTTAFNGSIDEVRFWEKDLTQTQIRDNMCKKLMGTENFLKAYFRFDEKVGAITENKAESATADGVLMNTPVWEVSNAPLGDTSVSIYGGVAGILTDTDVFGVSGMVGSPAGFHIYKVRETPNILPPPTNYGALLTSRYWGIFVVDGTTPKFDITYSFATNTDVTKPNALRFAKRNNPNGLLWLPLGGISNGLTKKLSRRNADAGEFALGQRNSIISNALNGGTVLDVDGITKTATTSNPLTGNDFTIEFWLKMPTNATQTGVKWTEGRRILTMESLANKTDYGISLLNNKFAFGIRDAGGTDNTVQSTAVANSDKWYHIAVTRNKTSGELQLFINGKLDASLNTSNTITLGGGINMLISKDSIGANTWQGYVDELRLWNSVLSANTIKDMMNLRANETHPNYNDLTAYYRFDENTGILCEDIQDGDDMALGITGMFTAADQALGDGYALRRNITGANQLASFWGAGTPEVDIQFSATSPEGELVATRVSATPNNYPASSGTMGSGNVASWSGVTSFMNCYWVIRNYGTNTTFSSLTNIKFEIPSGNSLGGVTNAAEIKLFKRPTNSTDASDWKLVGVGTSFGSINFAAGGPTDIDQFSEFIIGSGSAPLGVTLTEFKGKRLDAEQVLLQWNTTQEKQNAGFEIQRSTDGQDFVQIGFLDGKGDTHTPQAYNSTDTKAEGSFYYRLLQTDRDGTSTYSPIVYVKAEVGKQELTLYPNPVSKELKINVSGAVNGTMRAEIFDVQGKLIWEGKGNLKELENSLNKQVEDWKEGVYLFRLYSPDKVLERKFIKKR